MSAGEPSATIWTSPAVATSAMALSAEPVASTVIARKVPEPDGANIST